MIKDKLQVYVKVWEGWVKAGGYGVQEVIG